MTARSVDGMDVVATYEATGEAVSQVRSGAGPVFLEFRTYRFRAHSMFDAELYRDKDEVDAWKTRGPIHTFTARLKAEGKTRRSGIPGARRRRRCRGSAPGRRLCRSRRGEPVQDLLTESMTQHPERTP